MRKQSKPIPHLAKGIKPAPPAAESAPKSEIVLRMLARARGASIDELTNATGWRAHSVRGFLSGELKKKRQLNILSERVKGVKRHRLVSAS